MTTEAPVQPAAAAPELIAGKYKDVNELVAAYKALESKLGSTPAAAPVAVDPLNPPATVGKDGLSIQMPTTPVAGNALEAAYSKSTETALTEADYATLQTQGFSKSTVDAHIEGRNAVFSTQKNAIFTAAGGEAQFKTMVSWAGSNLSPGEVTAFNNAIKSRDAATMSMAVTSLASRYRAKMGAEPAVLDGGRPTVSAGALFANRAEYYNVTGSPQYRKDAAFRATVDARFRATNAANPNF